MKLNADQSRDAATLTRAVAVDPNIRSAEADDALRRELLTLIASSEIAPYDDPAARKRAAAIIARNA